MTSVPIDQARDLSKPATKNDGFGETPNISLKGHTDQMMGLKTNTLFSGNVTNEKERFHRLENAVDGIHQNFEEMKPSLQRLVSVERDLQDLMVQLEALANDEPIRPRTVMPSNLNSIAAPQAAQAQAKPLSISTAQTKTAPTPKALPIVDYSKAVIQDLRLADHAGKTRLVIETTQHLKYSASLDQSENLLTLSFESGDITFNPSGLSRKSKLVNAVTTTDEDNGSLIILELSGASDLIQQGRIKPNKDNAYHRIFIDLKR